MTWQLSSGKNLHVDEESFQGIKDLLAYHSPAFKPEERLLVSLSSSLLTVQKYIFTADTSGRKPAGGIKAPVRHIKLMRKMFRRGVDFYKALHVAGPYLFCTLLVPPWLIRFKPEFLGPSAGSPPDDDTNNTKCIVEVRGLRGQISQFLLVEEGLVVVASQRSLFLLENLDVLNPPDEISLSAEVTSVCLAESISKEEAAEWYIVLIALNNGCIDYLRISKARSTLPLLLPPPPSLLFPFFEFLSSPPLFLLFISERGLVWLKPREWELTKEIFRFHVPVLDIRTLALSGKPSMVSFHSHTQLHLATTLDNNLLLIFK